MGKGRFLNQKLGKRASRKLELLKTKLPTESTRLHTSARNRETQKAVSRKRKAAINRG